MFFQCYNENGVNAVLYKACSWMTLLACMTRMLCMWTLIPSNLRDFPRRLCTVRLTWPSSARTRKVCFRFGSSRQQIIMGCRLRAHIHRLASNYLWNRDWETLRPWHFSPSLDSDSPRDQGELGQRPGWSDRRREEHLASRRSARAQVVIHSIRSTLSDAFQVAEFYQILLDAALSDPNTPHGRDGYYIVENGEYKLHDLAKAYSQALYDLGKGKSPEPTSFTAEEAQKYFGVISAIFFVHLRRG